MPRKIRTDQRFSQLKRERDRLKASIDHRKSHLTNALLTASARSKIQRQIATKAKRMEEIKREIAQLNNEHS